MDDPWAPRRESALVKRLKKQKQDEKCHDETVLGIWFSYCFWCFAVYVLFMVFYYVRETRSASGYVGVELCTGRLSSVSCYTGNAGVKEDLLYLCSETCVDTEAQE